MSQNKISNSTPTSACSHTLAVCCLLTALLASPVSASCAAAPAQAGLRYPAGAQQAPQPAGIWVDARGEIYVADALGSRIIIYDHDGNYEFEFSTRTRLSGPRQVAVDSKGRIFVLSESMPRGLLVFDYDGEYLRDLELPFPSDDSELEPGSFVIHDEHILFLRPVPARVTEFDLDGRLIRELAILSEMDEETRNAPILGTMAVLNNLITIPLPMTAQVARYSLDGDFHDLIGMAGGAPGSLSFPVAVAGDGRDGLVVLDKHRHALLHYTADGKFSHELGGYGQSEGWFYYPSAVATARDGRCLIGQNFLNRLQWVSIFGESKDGNAVPASR